MKLLTELMSHPVCTIINHFGHKIAFNDQIIDSK